MQSNTQKPRLIFSRLATTLWFQVRCSHGTCAPFQIEPVKIGHTVNPDASWPLMLAFIDRHNERKPIATLPDDPFGDM